MVQVRRQTNEAKGSESIRGRVGGEIETVGVAPVPDDQRVQTPRQMFIVWLMASASATTPLIGSLLFKFGLTDMIIAIVGAFLIGFIPAGLFSEMGREVPLSGLVVARKTYGWDGSLLFSVLFSLVNLGWFGLNTEVGASILAAITHSPVDLWDVIVGGTRPGHLGRADRDQGSGLAGGRLVQAAGTQRLARERHHLLAVAEHGIRAGEPVADYRGQRLAARVMSGLGQRLAEQHFRLARLSGRERHRAEHAAAQRGRRRRLHRLAQDQAASLLAQRQVQCRGQQPPFPVGLRGGDARGPLQVRGGQR
jgi:Permease for cytosine/purines, uracil, thiamine, allantoin